MFWESGWALSFSFSKREDNSDEIVSKKEKVSFKSNEALEAGSRSPHLKGKDIELKWNLIYKGDK